MVSHSLLFLVDTGNFELLIFIIIAIITLKTVIIKWDIGGASRRTTGRCPTRMIFTDYAGGIFIGSVFRQLIPFTIGSPFNSSIFTQDLHIEFYSHLLLIFNSVNEFLILSLFHSSYFLFISIHSLHCHVLFQIQSLHLRRSFHVFYVVTIFRNQRFVIINPRFGFLYDIKSHHGLSSKWLRMRIFSIGITFVGTLFDQFSSRNFL